MSYTGQSPTLKRTRYTPQAADPVNPIDGDFFMSDGTPRAEGPWIYFNSAWQQVSVSGALTTVNDLTFTPQASDPGSPATGMVFYADGTSRAAGLWLYNGTGWVQLSGVRYQEFYVKDYVETLVATTANVTLATQLENGDTLDGVVLVTGDVILVKNQTTATENGVYVVAASGAPSRHSSADSADKLNRYSASVVNGTVNADTTWFQTATLASLATNQTWASSPGSFTMTVPTGIDQVEIVAVGGGASGGTGGSVNSAGSVQGAGGGGGGSAAPIVRMALPVVAGTITITPGKGGLRNHQSAAGGATGGAGAVGAVTIIAHDTTTITIPAAGSGGTGGIGTVAASGAGGAQSGVLITPVSAGVFDAAFGGAGGAGNPSTSGSDGQDTISTAGGAGGSGGSRGGSGGGGGGSIVVGSAGGVGYSGTYAFTISNTQRGLNASNKGAGGGGGGGSGNNAGGNRRGAPGGHGGCGYVRISW